VRETAAPPSATSRSIKFFVEVAGGSLAKRQISEIVFSAHGEHDYLCLDLVVGNHLLKDRDPVQSGQNHVEQDDVGLVVARRPQRVASIVGLAHHQNLRWSQHVPDHAAYERIVVDHEHAQPRSGLRALVLRT
jgi:hypothetical protein